MAVVTRTVASFDDGRVQFQIDYDDGTLRITAVRGINTSSADAYAEAVQELEPDAQSAKGRTYGKVFLAGTTTEIAVPTNPSLKLQYTIDPASGRIDGVTINARWPA